MVLLAIDGVLADIQNLSQGVLRRHARMPRSVTQTPSLKTTGNTQ
jgi:hypothetical protein